MDEVINTSPNVRWDSIAGQALAKQTLQEAVIFPMQRPDIFTGLRAPPKGVLLFGPPGTGKTLLAKAVATESSGTFFSISASSLTSKWVGEGEKLVRALFSVAQRTQPSVIFMDEMDSVLGARGGNEHEASRRLKTEFLVQLDGVGSAAADRLLVMGATNLPQELDEAVIRRMVKRIYVPLPDSEARKVLIQRLIDGQKNNLTNRQLSRVVNMSEGYSGSDLTALCKEAAMTPVRDLGSRIKDIHVDDVRAITCDDFVAALRIIRPSVSKDSLAAYQEWNSLYGATS